MAHEEYDYSSHENQCIVNIGIEKEIYYLEKHV